jgi:uncharacterized membrane protein
VGESGFATWPVALYGAVLLLAAIAYYVLTRVLISVHGSDSALATAVGRDLKGKASVVAYVAAIPLSFASSLLAFAVYVFVAVLWLVPDRRIEKVLIR